MALLELKGINHSFGGLAALTGFDLTIEPGELLGLIGPNGAGKTTVFNLVSGFYTPDRGSMVFNGTNIVGRRPHAITGLGLARTFQNIRLWPSLTVLENLCLAQHHHLGYGLRHLLMNYGRVRQSEAALRQRAMELLDFLGLMAAAHEQPANLAYGLQRRVEIARALAARPRLLLLDEPAAGLNPAEIEQLIDLIRSLRQEFSLTIWLIEHQMRVVMTLCERITVLDFGMVIAQGPPELIRSDPKVIKAYLGEDGGRHAGH